MHKMKSNYLNFFVFLDAKYKTNFTTTEILSMKKLELSNAL